MKRFAPIFLLVLFASAYVVSPARADCSSPTPTPPPSYSSIVLGTQSAHLLGYWQLNETGGTAATDSSGHSRDGSYSGPTLNGTTFTDGSPAPTFDGVNDFVNLYSTSLASVFNWNQGTLSIWIKPDATFLASATSGEITVFSDAGFSNVIQVFKSGSANTFFFRRMEAGTAHTVTVTNSSSAWAHYVFTWNVTSNAITAFINGSSVGTPTTAGSITATLGSSRAALGSVSTSGTIPWKGALAQAALWDTVLTGSEITALAASPSPTPTPAPTCTPTATFTPSPTLTPTITPSQSPTPTLTPSPTFTASPTLSFDVFITLPPPDSTGTPQPGQSAVFGYRFTAGQMGIVIVEVMILFSIWIIFVVIVLVYRRRKAPKPTNNINSQTL